MSLEFAQQHSHRIRDRLRMASVGCPFDEFDIGPLRVHGAKNPGTHIRSGRSFSDSCPVEQVCGMFAGYNSDRGLEVAAQRNSQKTPMTMVLSPVNCPNMRAHISETTAARPIKYPVTSA